MQTICNYCSSNLSAEACQKIQLTKTDEEFVRNLADDYILYKAFGRKDCHSKVAATMKRIGKEMEEKYQMFFNGVCTRLELNEDNVETAFQQISDEVFQDSVNWGRIVSMFVFSGKVAVKLVELHRSQRVEDVVTWLTNCIVNKQGWIDANGGWVRRITSCTSTIDCLKPGLHLVVKITEYACEDASKIILKL